MLDAKKWMYIPLNLKVEFENFTVAYEKLNVKSGNSRGTQQEYSSKPLKHSIV